MSERVNLDIISDDGRTQARVKTDAATVREYADSMRDGSDFPPVVLFRDGDGIHRIGDGYHRVAGARLAGRTHIEAEVRDGGTREALGWSIQANGRHGLRFTNADKRRAVGLMLDDPEWSRLSDREISRRCSVSQPFVSKARREKADNGYHSGPLTEEERRLLAENEATIERNLPGLLKHLEEVSERIESVGPTAFFAQLAAEQGDQAVREFAEHLDLLRNLFGDPPSRAGEAGAEAMAV